MQSRDALQSSRDALDAAAGARSREYWTCVRAHFTAVRAGARDAARVSRRELDALALEIFGARAADGAPRAGYRAHEAFVEHLYAMLRQAKASTSAAAARTTPDVDARRRVGLLEASGDVAPRAALPTTASAAAASTASAGAESLKSVPPSAPTTASAPRAKRARAMGAYPKSSSAAVKSASTSFGIPLGAPRHHASGGIDRALLQARARVMRRDIAASVRVREDVVEVLRAATRVRVLAVARAALDARDAFGLAGVRACGSARARRVTLVDFCVDSSFDVVGVASRAYAASRSSARRGAAT